MGDFRKQRLKDDIDLLERGDLQFLNGELSMTEFLSTVISRLTTLRATVVGKEATREIDSVSGKLSTLYDAIKKIESMQYMDNSLHISNEDLNIIAGAPELLRKTRGLFAEADKEENFKFTPQESMAFQKQLAFQERLTDAAAEMQRIVNDIPGLGKRRAQ